ncbi:MAG: extracellular solute-binding protein [Oscillospiraceae bacterium]|nr:extracellular solute-binding protein [Oscillospiraceae bacterium]
MKKVLSILLVLAMLFSLAACAGGNGGGENPSGEAPSGETPTGEAQNGDSPLAGTYDIKVWVAEAITDLTQKQIEDFNNTNTDGIKFNATVQAVGEDIVATQLITDVEAAGDIFIFAQDQFARLIQAGALAQLGEGASQIVKDNNTPEAVAAVTLNDGLYGYPVTADNGYFMYYDKSVIPEEDVDSLEKLIEDCEAAGKYFSMELQTSAWYLASFFFATGCVSEWTIDDDGMATALNDTFDSPEGLIAAKGMKKLLDSPAHVSSSQASDFAAGSAVLVCGTWAYDDIKAILGDNLGATDLPSFEVDGEEYHLGSFSGFKLMGVKPQTDVTRQAALHKLAQYLTGEQCQLERFNERSWGPSNIVAQQDPAVAANAGQIAINLQAPYATPQGQISGAWWNIAKVIADEVKDAADEEGIQAALTNYSQKCNALIGVGGYVFVGAWNGWDNADMTHKLTEEDGVYTITVEVEESDYMGGRIVTATNWDTDHGAAQVTTGADLIDMEAAGGDNNIVFKEAGNYTVTWNADTNEITIVKN